MSSHTILTPGQIKKNQFSDISDHRVHLPSLYNGYRRTNADPELLQKMEDERCSLFPAFVTSFVLYDYLVDNNFFGAEQLLIGSVSSKTGFGLAHMLRSDENISAKIVGLTSSGHTDFVNTLNCCDDVVEYGKETDIDTSLTTTYVDMSGDVALKTSLHNHLQDNLVGSCVVGVSHWENRGDAGDLPGAKPAFFFVPGHIAKRDEEWGPGVTVMRAMQASTKVATHVKNHINLEWVKGSDDLINVWGRLLDNKVPPSRGLLASLL